MSSIHQLLAITLLLATAALANAADGATKLAEVLKGLDAAEGADAKVKALVKDKLGAICVDGKVVAAVQAQNASGLTLDQIKKDDEAWKNAEDVLPIQEEKLTNELAAHLMTALDGMPIAECFVMDKLGANVGQTALTGDYWQGDEAKFTNSYQAGKGGVDVGDVELDDSTGEVLQQISLPIIAADGSVIGAVTFGITVSAL